MSDYSDLVARLRADADKWDRHGATYQSQQTSRLEREAADALDVKPGANADLIAEARHWCDNECPRSSNMPLIRRLADALEAADSRALPTREQIIDAIQKVCRKYFLVGVLADRNRKCAGRIADAVLALLTGGKADE